MLQWIGKHWFLLALAVVYLTGLLGAERLAPIADYPGIRSFVVVFVMWAMGVTLAPDAIRESVRKPTASLLAICTNLFLVPVLCLPAIYFLPADLGGGLFVAGLVPCTLASASVWTRKAGGDDSVSIMTTMVTYLSCVVVVPLGIQMVLALQTHVAPLAQMEKLACFVVAPLVVAQLMRRFGFATLADRYKRQLSFAAQIGILAVVFFGAMAGSGYGRAMGPVAITMIAFVAFSAVSVHLVSMVFAIFVARRCGLSRAEQIAVGISGSQKTLMVGLHLAIDCGVSVLPMLIYHAGQLVIDTLIAERWRLKSDRA